MHHNQHQSHHRQLREGLESGDLSRLVEPRVTVDEYKSKIGDDDSIMVLAFRVQGRDPALDLVSFIEKSYEWVLDADTSSGELDDGTYLVFVEADREPELANEVYKLFEDLANLTDIKFNEWIISNHKPHRSESLTRDTFQKIIPLTPEDYRNQNFKSREQLDNLRATAGVSVETRAPKNDFTESLRIAAGIR